MTPHRIAAGDATVLAIRYEVVDTSWYQEGGSFKDDCTLEFHFQVRFVPEPLGGLPRKKGSEVECAGSGKAAKVAVDDLTRLYGGPGRFTWFGEVLRDRMPEALPVRFRCEDV